MLNTLQTTYLKQVFGYESQAQVVVGVIVRLKKEKQEAEECTTIGVDRIWHIMSSHGEIGPEQASMIVRRNYGRSGHIKQRNYRHSEPMLKTKGRPVTSSIRWTKKASSP